PICFGLPRAKLGNAALRMGKSLVPGGPLGSDRRSPRGARRSLASDGCRPPGAAPPTPFRFRRGGFAGRGSRARRFDAQRRRRLTRRLGFPLEVAEAILFHQAPRGRSRRFGGGNEAVPAP